MHTRGYQAIGVVFRVCAWDDMWGSASCWVLFRNKMPETVPLANGEIKNTIVAYKVRPTFSRFFDAFQSFPNPLFQIEIKISYFAFKIEIIYV